MILWNSVDAATATNSQTGSWHASRVVIDSRAVAPGDLFVAIIGERLDGHDFVAQAFANGAAAALVSTPRPEWPQDKLLVVNETLEGLTALARFARARARARIVAITGSVGKTSAKEMLRLALSGHGTTHASHGNFNNHIGAPLGLANLPPDADFAVFELGMNHAGEIAALTRLVRPHIAAITNVEAVHLEFFATVADIARAKAEIFEGLEPAGVAILPADSPYLGILRDACHEQGIERIITFGGTKSDCCITAYKPTLQGSQITLQTASEMLTFPLHAIGRHWGITTALIAATAQALGLNLAKTTQALAPFEEPAGRGKITAIDVNGATVLLIDDSYNASPVSMRAAIAKLAEIPARRRIAALGNMLELGDNAANLHAELTDDLTLHQIDLVLTAGHWMKYLHDTLPAPMRAAHAAEAMELLGYLKNILQGGDVLLIKGSHGSKMHQLVASLNPPSTMKKDLQYAL